MPMNDEVSGEGGTKEAEEEERKAYLAVAFFRPSSSARPSVSMAGLCFACLRMVARKVSLDVAALASALGAIVVENTDIGIDEETLWIWMLRPAVVNPEKSAVSEYFEAIQREKNTYQWPLELLRVYARMVFVIEV